MSLFIYFFFFSSRRRHTRCSRDWSSDVCSSDLSTLPAPEQPMQWSRRSISWTSFSSPWVRARDSNRDVDLAVGRPIVPAHTGRGRSEEHTSELQSRLHLVCRLLLEKKKKKDICIAI